MRPQQLPFAEKIVEEVQHECRGEQRLHYHANERVTNMKDEDTTTTVVTEGGSFGLTIASENKAE